MPNYAVIDLGSNTIRLVVYEVKDDRRKTYSSKDFKSLINDKVMAGLSAFVTADGTFTDDGVRRAASVLKGHAKRARYFDCKRIDVFATAVLRNAANSAEAVAAIERESGLTIDLLSAADEAHLGFAGATQAPRATARSSAARWWTSAAAPRSSPVSRTGATSIT